jgi:Type II secretion system (T2SS), protein G
MKRATVILISLLFVFTLLFIASRWWESAPVGTGKAAESTPGPVQGNSQPSIAPVDAVPKTPPTLEEGRIATEKVTNMITSFHTRMGENPVGTNAEIMKSLMGENPIHATFSPDPPTLNAKGELIDPWGTPYFFHQISGDEMEIRSAGPDKIMGTPDDIVEN